MWGIQSFRHRYLGTLTDCYYVLSCAFLCCHLEPMTRIELAHSDWKSDVLPLNYIGILPSLPAVTTGFHRVRHKVSSRYPGGAGGIRTLARSSRLTVFKTAPLPLGYHSLLQRAGFEPAMPSLNTKNPAINQESCPLDQRCVFLPASAGRVWV